MLENKYAYVISYMSKEGTIISIICYDTYFIIYSILLLEMHVILRKQTLNMLLHSLIFFHV